MSEKDKQDMPPRKKRTKRRFGTITKRRNRFHVSFKGLDGKRYSAGRGFATYEQAAVWLNQEEERQDAARRGYTNWVPPQVEEEHRKQAGKTVGQWLEEYHDSMAPTLRLSTLRQYQNTTKSRLTEIPGAPDCHDMHRLREIPLTELSKDDVRRWWDAMVQAFPEQEETNKKAYKRLRAACAEAVHRELIDRNPVDIPTATRRTTKEDGYLPSDDEIQSILEAMAPRYRVLTSLVLFHGLRIGEAIALERGDVEVSGEVPFKPRVVVHVRQNAQRVPPPNPVGHVYMNFQPPKTHAGARDVPIMPAHTGLFMRHLAEYAPTTCVEVRTDTTLTEGTKKVVLLTATDKGAPVMDTSFRSVLDRAKKRAGVHSPITPHAGRRWLITRLAENGAHLKEIGRLLGQDDFDTITKIYMQVRAGRTTELVDAVSFGLYEEGQFS